MAKVLECPYCSAANIKTKEQQEEVKGFGKVVIECNYCSRLFILRDDGDGEYTYGTR